MFLTELQTKAVKQLRDNGGFTFSAKGSRLVKTTKLVAGKWEYTYQEVKGNTFVTHRRRDNDWKQPSQYDFISLKTAGELQNKELVKLHIVIQNQWIELLLTELGRRVAMDLQ